MLNNLKMQSKLGQNNRVYLCSRPGKCSPVSLENFAIETIAVPKCDDGEILVKTLCLSVGPYMRCRFNADSGVAYAKSWEIGDTIDASGVGTVIESKDNSHCLGDMIYLPMCWPFQNYVKFNPSAMLSNADPTVGAHSLMKVPHPYETSNFFNKHKQTHCL